MMILGIQIMGVLFALFMLYVVFIFFKKNEFTAREWIVWSAMWILFIALAIFPQALDPILISLHLTRAMDFFISLGFMFFAGIIFYTYIIVRSNQKKIEILIREIAFLKDMENLKNELLKRLKEDIEKGGEKNEANKDRRTKEK